MGPVSGPFAGDLPLKAVYPVLSEKIRRKQRLVSKAVILGGVTGLRCCSFLHFLLRGLDKDILLAGLGAIIPVHLLRRVSR